MYRWHPLYGKRVVVVRRVQVAGQEYAHIEGREKFSRELPAWMLDVAICSRMALDSPLVSIAALLELLEVLRADLVAVSGVTVARSGDEKDPRQSADESRAPRSVRGGPGTSGNRSLRVRRDTQRSGRTASRRDATKRKGADQ